MSVAEACDILARALPVAAALLAEPDVTPATGHVQPGSRPPWNPEAADALFSALEGVRRLEAWIRELTGAAPARRRSYRQTGAVIRSVRRYETALADASDHVPKARPEDPECACGTCVTVALLRRWAGAVDRLPAVDEAPKWSRIPVACHCCGGDWLYVARQSGSARCACCGLEGRMESGRFGPQVLWSDGTVWQAA